MPLSWRRLLFATLGAMLGGAAGYASAAGAELFTDPKLNANKARIQADLRKAQLVFVGVVESVGAAPPSWSGILEIRQRVTYRVKRILRGGYGRSEITVAHLVVAHSRNAAHRPGLSPAIFAAGRTLIVSADGTATADEWRDFDENFGTLRATADNETAVDALLWNR